jgi:prevent-host-death family protein
VPLVVDVQEAKTRLLELLVRVERGEEVVVARSGRPVAHLAAVSPAPPGAFGLLELTVPDSFFQVLDEAELAAWE